MDFDADRTALDTEERRGRDGCEHGLLPKVRDAHTTWEGKRHAGMPGHRMRGV